MEQQGQVSADQSRVLVRHLRTMRAAEAEALPWHLKRGGGTKEQKEYIDNFEYVSAKLNFSSIPRNDSDGKHKFQKLIPHSLSVYLSISIFILPICNCWAPGLPLASPRKMGTKNQPYVRQKLTNRCFSIVQQQNSYVSRWIKAKRKNIGRPTWGSNPRPWD